MALTARRRRPDDEAPVRQQPSGTLLGELLLADGAITFEQLREALCRQQESGERLGEILVKMHAVTPLQLERALELQACLRDASEP